MDSREGPILAPVRARFRALARAIVPESAELDESGWAEVEAIIEEALARRPASMRRQLQLFIRALDLLPAVRWGRTFRRLGPARRTRFLEAVQSSRLFIIRRGFWGLRTLVFMGYYARPAAHAGIGYDARTRGWLEHPDAPEDARRTTRELQAAEADGATPRDRRGRGLGGGPRER